MVLILTTNAVYGYPCNKKRKQIDEQDDSSVLIKRQSRTFIPPTEAVHVEIVTGKVKVNNAEKSDQMGGRPVNQHKMKIQSGELSPEKAILENNICNRTFVEQTP